MSEGVVEALKRIADQTEDRLTDLVLSVYRGARIKRLFVSRTEAVAVSYDMERIFHLPNAPEFSWEDRIAQVDRSVMFMGIKLAVRGDDEPLALMAGARG